MCPIYDFVCENKECKHEFDEVFSSWNDNTSKIRCPKCGSKAKKVPSLNAQMKQNWSAWNAMG